MSEREPLRRATELERLGVVVVVDADRRVVHVSEHCDAILGRAAGELVGLPLAEAAGADADATLRDVLADGLERAGGWWPVQLPGDHRSKLRAFEVAPGLVGLDVLPVHAAGAAVADADSIERVAGWNDWLLACTSSTDLLRAVASVTRDRLGFDGVWAHRIEGDGRDVVVAADVDAGAPDLVGKSAPASDVPPAQPRVRGRAVPYFVADLGADGTTLAPGSPELDLEGSALLRPYPEFLGRLASLGVRATAGLPLIVDGRLWGRVIAHHPAAQRVSAATQSELRLLGVAASARLAELLQQEDAREQVELARFSLRLMGSVAASADLVDGLTNDLDDLAGICAADGAIVSIGGRVASAGVSASSAEIEELLRVARAALGPGMGNTLSASVTLDGPTGIDPRVAAGYLAVRLGQDAQDVVMWVRRESERAVTWIEHQVVGDAIADALFTGVTHRQELSVGACAAWTAAQVAQADELREAIGQVLIARLRQVQALNAELARSNDEYDAFAHAAAHDLKAPLRGIRQNVEFHLEDTEGRLSDPEQEQLHTVTRLVDRMNGLLDDLMRYAQVGQDAWNPRPVAVDGAVAEVVELLGPSVARSTVLAGPDRFTTDPAALRQILLNLVGNAAKYSDGPARILVGTTTLGEVALHTPPPASLAAAPAATPVLTVSDDGIGIHPDHQDRIFALFQQLDPKADGTGTGLALCRLICRRHGGDIWLSSALGEGSTFYVSTGGAGSAADAADAAAPAAASGLDVDAGPADPFSAAQAAQAALAAAGE